MMEKINLQGKSAAGKKESDQRRPADKLYQCAAPIQQRSFGKPPKPDRDNIYCFKNFGS